MKKNNTFLLQVKATNMKRPCNVLRPTKTYQTGSRSTNPAAKPVIHVRPIMTANLWKNIQNWYHTYYVLSRSRLLIVRQEDLSYSSHYHLQVKANSKKLHKKTDHIFSFYSRLRNKRSPLNKRSPWNICQKQ